MTGYVSLEWVKRWAQDLTDAGIVFPQFANYMHDYFATLSLKEGELQDNHGHTGKYVWPKEHLIDLTFPEVLDRMVKEFPDQYAFRYTDLDYTRTYAQFRDDVDQFARAADRHGREEGGPCGHLGHQRAPVVHHLLGHHQNRRGAGDGEHRL